ncbi:transposase [Tenacibaculum finnmarkense]|nr:transposase [Tenacibaculum finnmarkense]SOS55833.1 transposase [Tenacibaculum finnmarkense]
MDCPKCKSEKKIKNGVIKGIQRYKCKSCGYNYTVERRSCDYPLSTKNKALQLYLEGLGFRSVGRLLGVSNVSVLNWIRAFGNEISSLQPESQDIEMVEVDEMHSYIGHKKTTVGFGLPLIDTAKDSSTSLLEIEAQKQPRSFGKELKTTK